MWKAVRLEIDLPSPPALETFRRRHRVDLNVLRARVTESRAWYLLDVSGAAAKVEAAVRHFRERGFALRTHSLETSYA